MRKIALMLAMLLVAAACGDGEPAATETAATEDDPATDGTVATDAPTSDEGGTEAASGEPVKVGFVDSLTGPLNIWGVPNMQGMELGFEYATDGTMEVAGRPIEILVRDDASDAETGLDVARELIEAEEVDFLMGTISSGVTNAITDLVAEQENVIYMAHNAGHQTTSEWFNPYTFRISRNTYIDMIGLVEFVAAEDPDASWVHLVPDYAFGESIDTAFQFALDEVGPDMTLASTLAAPLDTTDFTPFLQQIAQEEPSHLLANWVGSGVVPLFQQLNDTGLGDIEVGGLLNPLAGNGIQSYSTAIGSLGTTPYYWDFLDTEANDWFVERHREEFGEAPDALSGTTFSAAMAIVQAIEETGGSTEPNDLIAVLEGMEFDSLYGTTTIRAEDHQGLLPLYIGRVTNVDDPEQRYLELVEEIPAEVAAPPCLVEERC